MITTEYRRLAFLEQRDGIAGAVDFAKRTLRIYRRCVLMNGRNRRKFHYASVPPYRLQFILSYLTLKNYVQKNTPAEAGVANHSGE